MHRLEAVEMPLGSRSLNWQKDRIDPRRECIRVVGV